MRRAILLLLCGFRVLQAESAAGLSWTAPAGWVSKGAATMRAATYTAGDSECVVYFFGPGQGGSIEANLTRWKGQFTRNGQAAPASISKKVVRGINITEMEVAGVYSGTGGPAMAPQTPKPGSRMMAAIIEGPGGNLFVKFTGPENTIRANAAGFEALLASFRKE